MRVVDERPHLEAVLAALNTALGGEVEAYDYGTVPGVDGNAGAVPPIYVLAAVYRRVNTGLRLDAGTNVTRWRITVEVVGRTGNEARWALGRVAALEEQALEIAGLTSTPVQFETGDPVDRDDNRYVGRSDWTYSLL